MTTLSCAWGLVEKAYKTLVFRTNFTTRVQEQEVLVLDGGQLHRRSLPAAKGLVTNKMTLLGNETSSSHHGFNKFEPI